MTPRETVDTTPYCPAADPSHNTGPLRTELVCYEPGCQFETRTPFPVCIDELTDHDCPQGGADDGR